MCHASPAAYMVWGVLFSLLGAFLVFHLWSFDRFKCLKWNSGPYSGAFKRLMTYSYLTSVPLVVVYAVGFAVIKYHEGFMEVNGVGVIPKPYQFWEASRRSLIFPLYLLFSIAWSLEMVTHLEELCFWLFLINAGSAQQDWFRSPYFKSWMVGSICAVIYMPVLTIATKGDPLRCEAFTVLGGSLGSLAITLWFIPILWAFPVFLSNLRIEGVDMSIIVRLTKFHELNILRIAFRFLFVIPFLALAVDGVRPHPVTGTKMGLIDFFTVLAGIGCVISSAITLVIFFPRSIEGEIAARDATRDKRTQRSTAQAELRETQLSTNSVGRPSVSSPVYGKSPYTASVASHEAYDPPPPSKPVWKKPATSENNGMHDTKGDGLALGHPVRHQKRPDEERGNAAFSDEGGYSNLNIRKLRKPKSKINPFVHKFKSPIDLAENSEDLREPKYKFTRNMA